MMAGAPGASCSTSRPKSGAPTRPTCSRGSRVLSLLRITYTRPVSGSLRTDAGTRISNLTCARPEGPGRITDVCAGGAGEDGAANNCKRDPHDHFKSSPMIGSVRTRLPVAAKMALHTAGAAAGSPGSPSPVGGATDLMK